MTKEELKQIYSLNREIKMWQKELEKLQCQSLVKGQEITDMPYGSGTTDKVGNMAVDRAEIESVIKGKLAEIQLQRKRILNFIGQIEESENRQIIYLYNVSGFDWREIAKEFGEGYTDDCIRQKYYRCLKKYNVN